MSHHIKKNLLSDLKEKKKKIQEVNPEKSNPNPLPAYSLSNPKIKSNKNQMVKE